MTKFLYRFRPLSRFLTELEKQEIYLAAAPELNDPMEGSIDFFWDGDNVLWENLIRHYVSCLHYAYLLYTLVSESKEITWDLIPINDPTGALRRLIGKERQQELVAAVMAEPLINAYIAELVHRRNPVRSNELTLHVDNLHGLIYEVITGQFMPPLKNEILIAERARIMNHHRDQLDHNIGIFRHIENLEGNTQGTRDSTESYCSEELVRQMGQDLGYEYRHSNIESFRNQKLLAHDFAAEYVREVQRLVYPSFYTACFMEECKSASLWASYGSNHSGICLKYKVQAQESEGTTKYYLPLYGRRTGEDRNGPVFSHTHEYFFPISYEPRLKQHSMNFFSWLGVLPAPITNRDWYTLKGTRTQKVELGDWGAEKRETYWKTFVEVVTSKLKVWDQEGERRLLYYRMDFGDIPKEQRLFNYRFEDLDGVIFGIRTTRQDKLKVIKAISEKCKETGRNDFKFYQANYSTESHSIEYRHLSSLAI